MSDESKSIFIKNVRCLFPALHVKPKFGGEEARNYGAKILLHKEKDAALISELKAVIQSLVVSSLREKKLPAASISLTDGDDSTKDYYAGHWILSANNRAKPYVVAPNGKDRITDPEEDRIYGGCNVDCRVSFWPQSAGPTWGKRVNCNLLSIRFSSDGAPYEGGGVSVEEAVEGFGAQEEQTPDW